MNGKFNLVRIVGIILVLFLVSCREEMSPLIAGTVWYQAADGKPIERDLAPEELGSLNSWLKKRLSGWGYCLVTLPASSPFGIAVKHVNGKSSSLRVISEQTSGATVVAAYLVGSNMSDSPCALQTFPEQDIRELRAVFAIGQ